MLVSEILRIKGSTLFTATPDMSVKDAVHSMEQDIGSLVVMEKGKLVGTVDKTKVTKDEVLGMIIMGKLPDQMDQKELASLH